MSTYYLTPLKSYDSVFALAKDIGRYPGRFYEAFEEGNLLDYVREEDPAKYRRLVELKRQDYIPDVFLFKASYILNPYMELRYHGFVFKSYEEIGQVIKRFCPKIDVYLQDLLRFGLLAEYMKTQGDDVRKPELWARLEEVSKLYKTDHSLAYFSFAYALDPHDRSFHYDGRCYDDPKEFLRSRLPIGSLFEFAGRFEDDGAFQAWLLFLGYDTVLDRYQSLVSLIEEKERQCREFSKTSEANENSDPLALFYKGLEN